MSHMKELLTDPAVVGAAVGGLTVVARGAAIVFESHREISHKAIKLGPKLEKVTRFLQESIGIIPEVWAAIHRIHHRWSDVNGKAFLDLTRVIERAESLNIKVPNI